MSERGSLIALDGTDGIALGTAARALATDRRSDKPCVSVWDASGIFSEVQLATVGAGDPSVRTMLLLYAADLAYRVRAEVEPALAAGRLVIVAPYVDTAVAFAQAAGLDESWVAGMLSFAPTPSRRNVIKASTADAGERKGFVEFCCGQLMRQDEEVRLALLKRTATRLRQP